MHIAVDYVNPKRYLHYTQYAIRNRFSPKGFTRLAQGFNPAQELISRLGICQAELYGLLDQTKYDKSIDQLIALLNVLNCEVDVIVKTVKTLPLHIPYESLATANARKVTV